jgi:hypothetical protein
LGQKVSYLFFCLFQKIVNNNDQWILA